VATKTGGIPELIDDRRTGMLVPYGSVPGLASALTTLLKDENLSRRMGAEGRAKVEQNFTWEAVAAKVRSVYQELQQSR
jgi:starch synthase